MNTKMFFLILFQSVAALKIARGDGSGTTCTAEARTSNTAEGIKHPCNLCSQDLSYIDNSQPTHLTISHTGTSAKQDVEGNWVKNSDAPNTFVLDGEANDDTLILYSNGSHWIVSVRRLMDTAVINHPDCGKENTSNVPHGTFDHSNKDGMYNDITDGNLNLKWGSDATTTKEPEVADVDATTTKNPTAADDAEVKDDPHAQNMRNEKFDLLTLGQATLIHYPRQVPDEQAKLLVRADIQRLGTACYETVMKSLRLSGGWVEEPLAFEVVDNRALHMQVNDRWLRIAESVSFKRRNFYFHKRDVNTVSLSFNKTELSISSKEWKNVHYLNLKITGLSNLDEEVGGMLGLDGHEGEPEGHGQCEVPSFHRRAFRAVVV